MSTIVPLLAIIGTVCLFSWAFYSQHRKRSLQEKRLQMLKDPSPIHSWMKAEAFEPDHFSFHEGSAIGIKNGDARILLAHASTPHFHKLLDLRFADPHETVTTARPLGAAPGVVETREFRHYSLRIGFDEDKDVVHHIFFADADQMHLWKERLDELIVAQK